MKAHLLYRDRDFDPQAAQPPHEAALTQDLELNTLFDAMAAGDKFLLEVARKAVLTSLDEPDAILYRQQVLADCLDCSAIVREMYAIAVEALQREKGVWGALSPRSPDGVLYWSIEVLQRVMDLLKRLRHITDAHGGQFQSEGFTTLFDMFAEELDDDYLSIIKDHLRRLEFRGGVLMFVGLFVVVHAFQLHVVEQWGIEHWHWLLSRPVGLLSLVAAALSNLVSNVPAVLLMEPVLKAIPAATQETAWLALAMSSTLAGNLTILGSVANLIVLENGNREGVRVSFWEYCKVSVPLTILTLAVGIAWLAFVHY